MKKKLMRVHIKTQTTMEEGQKRKDSTTPGPHSYIATTN